MTSRDINKTFKEDQENQPSRFAVSTMDFLTEQVSANRLQEFIAEDEDQAELFEIYLKDLAIVYFVIALKTISYVFSKDKVKITTEGAYQLAFDLDYMMKALFESEIINQDPAYQQKLKQLKEIARWRRYLKMLLTGTRAQKDSRVLDIEIGDLKDIKRSVTKSSHLTMNKLRSSLAMLEI